MLPDDRLQQIILDKDIDKSLGGEGWAIIDNCMIIYDFEDPPHWFPQNLDEDGNTPEFVERMKSATKEGTPPGIASQR